jgi:hypothetical protein
MNIDPDLDPDLDLDLDSATIPSFEKVSELIKEWKIKYTAIKDFENKESPYYNNVFRAIQCCRETATFLTETIPLLKQWVYNYLEHNRNQIWLRIWIKNATDSILLPLEDTRYITKLHHRFLLEWPGNIQYNSELYSIDYNEAKEKAIEITEKIDLDNCDIPEILSIHEGRACESNGWFCWICDDMQIKWEKHLQTNIKKTKNIFINKSLQEDFINSCEVNIPRTWYPPKLYGDNYSMTYSKNEFYESALKSRREYSIISNTPVQSIKTVLLNVSHYSSSGWYLQWNTKTDTEINTFLALWSLLDVLPFCIDLDLKKCNEIMALF